MYEVISAYIKEQYDMFKKSFLFRSLFIILIKLSRKVELL